MPEKTEFGKEFRLGVVGVGLIAAQSHIPAAMGLPGVEITALVDTATDRVTSLAGEYGLETQITSNLGDVLEKLDGVVIATPNNSHADIAIQCLEAGVNVLIEKPLASTVSDGERICSAAEKTGGIAIAGYTTRFRDNVRLTRKLIQDETLGCPIRFAYQFGTPGGWPSVSAYNLDRTASGGGVTVVSGTHFLDRAIWFFGYPPSVSFEDDSRGGPEANAIAHFDYSGEKPLTGMARFSKTTALKTGLVVETDQGSIVLTELDDSPVIFHPKGQPHLSHVIEETETAEDASIEDVFQRQLLNFISSSRGIDEPVCDAASGLESMKLIEQLYACRTQMDDNWYE